VQFLFRLGQRSKPEASVEQYGALLGAAWEASVTNPSLHGFPMRLYRPSDDEDPDRFRRDYLEYAQLVADAWDQLNARRLEFESVRPDSRLSRVHEEAVKAFRGDLELHNHQAKRNIAIVEGNIAAAQKADNEAKHWKSIVERIDRKLAAALRKVQRTQPALFAALALPPRWIHIMDILLDETD
jgi:hypothetical protein